MLGVLINTMRGGRNQFLDTTPVMRRRLNKRRFLSLGKEDGLLYNHYKVGKHLVNQLVVPEALVPFVLHLKHDNAGHMAAEKTTNLIRREYFWLTMVEDVKKYCQSRVPWRC